MGLPYPISFKLIALTAIGVIFCAAGVTLLYVFPSYLRKEISSVVVLKEGSESYTEWQNPPLPIYMQFWMFAVQNPDDVKKGEKPIVKEVGPYTYKEERPKIDIVWNPNSTVSFRSPRYYYFDRDKSVGDDSDTFTFLNIPYITVATLIEDLNLGAVVKEAFSVFADAEKEKLVTQRSVREMLWGYKDTLFADLHRFVPSKDLPAEFGLFYGQNGTDDGLYTVYTGASDVANFTVIDKWNGEALLSWWKSKQCNMINGTDGTTFHPFVKKSDVLTLYSTDICRSVYCVYDSEVEVRGIKSWRFVAPPELFQNATLNPANEGFCSSPSTCLDSGVLDIGACKDDAPVIISCPHFYEGAEQYINAVEGMHPDPTQHQTFVSVQPDTGVLVEAARRIQVNIALKRIHDIWEVEHVRDVIFPTVWLNESVFIDEKSASTLKQEAILPQQIIYATQYAAIVIGCLILVSLIIFVIFKRVRLAQSADERPLISAVPGQDFQTL